MAAMYTALTPKPIMNLAPPSRTMDEDAEKRSVPAAAMPRQKVMVLRAPMASVRRPEGRQASAYAQKYMEPMNPRFLGEMPRSSISTGPTTADDERWKYDTT